MANNNIFRFNSDLFTRNTNTRLKATLLNRIEKQFDIDLKQNLKNDPVHADSLVYDDFSDMIEFVAIHKLIDRHAKRYADFNNVLATIFTNAVTQILAGRGKEVDEEFKDDKIVEPFIDDIKTLIAVINNLHEEEIAKLKVTMELLGDQCLVAKASDVEHVEVSIDKQALQHIIKGGQADSNG